MSIDNPDTDLAQGSAELESQYKSAFPQYRDLSAKLLVPIESLLNGASIAVAEVTSRPKDPASLSKKLRDKSYASLQDIPDLCGARIVLAYKDDIDKVAELLGDNFTIIEQDAHDKTATEFGYQSLHLICAISEERSKLPEWSQLADLRFELQVRSVLQHAWALINHELDYKADYQAPEAIRRKLFQMAALLETGDDVFVQVRREIEAEVAKYQDSASTQSWKNLPLNLNSLRAVSSEFPWSEIRAVGEEVGFATVEREPGEASYDTLLHVAKGLDLQTLGQLREEAALAASAGPDNYLARIVSANLQESEDPPRSSPQSLVALNALLRSPLKAPDIISGSPDWTDLQKKVLAAAVASQAAPS